MKSYLEDELLMLSGIQHYAFCKRQWALIHIEKQWVENIRTTEGHFLHEKVDDPYIVETRGTLVVARAVPIVSYTLGLYGIADMIEYVSSEKKADSIFLDKHTGYWQPTPVEYKRGKPKSDYRDAIQLCAQAICLEEAYGINIEKGFIFYGEIRRREQIVFDEEIRTMVKDLAIHMHEDFQKGETPPAYSSINCKLCSLIDICMPKLTKRNKSVSRYIEKTIAEIEVDG